MTNIAFRNTVWLMGLLMIGLFIVSYIAVCYYHVALHKLAILLVPVLGFIYMALVPIGAVPDERAHIATAYHISNIVLGVDDSGLQSGEIMKRADDASYEFWNLEGDPVFHDKMFTHVPLTRDQYTSYWGRLGTPLQDRTLVVSEGNIALPLRAFPPHQYFAPTLGLVVGRLFGVGTYDLYVMGRCFSLIVYTIFVVWAIALLPAKKSLLLVITLLPIALQQAMSFSYDSFTNAAAFWTMAMAFHLLYRPPASNRRFIVYFIALCVMSVLLATAKSKCYIAFLLLPLYILYQKGIIKKKLILIAVVVAVAIILIAVIGFFAWRLRLSDVSSFGGYLSDFISRCLVRARAFVVAYIDQMGPVIVKMINRPLGSMGLVPSWSSLLYVIPLLTLASVKHKGEAIALSKLERAILVVVFLISTFGLFVVFQMTYNEYSEGFAGAIQGRYLLPVLLPLLYATSTEKIEADASLDAFIIPGMVFLNFLTVISVLANVAVA